MSALVVFFKLCSVGHWSCRMLQDRGTLWLDKIPHLVLALGFLHCILVN